jgi:hypothetical protein
MPGLKSDSQLSRHRKPYSEPLRTALNPATAPLAPALAALRCAASRLGGEYWYRRSDHHYHSAQNKQTSKQASSLRYFKCLAFLIRTIVLELLISQYTGMKVVYFYALAAFAAAASVGAVETASYDLLVFPPGCLNKFLAFDIDVQCAKLTISKCLG